MDAVAGVGPCTGRQPPTRAWPEGTRRLRRAAAPVGVTLKATADAGDARSLCSGPRGSPVLGPVVLPVASSRVSPAIAPVGPAGVTSKAHTTAGPVDALPEGMRPLPMAAIAAALAGTSVATRAVEPLGATRQPCTSAVIEGQPGRMADPGVRVRAFPPTTPSGAVVEDIGRKRVSMGGRGTTGPLVPARGRRKVGPPGPEGATRGSCRSLVQMGASQVRAHHTVLLEPTAAELLLVHAVEATTCCRVPVGRTDGDLPARAHIAPSVLNVGVPERVPAASLNREVRRPSEVSVQTRVFAVFPKLYWLGEWSP